VKKSTSSTTKLLKVGRRRLRAQHLLVYETAQLLTFLDANAAKREREEIAEQSFAC